MGAFSSAFFLLMGFTGFAAGATNDVRLYAAGSLRNALTDVAAAYSQAYGDAVETIFAPSGLLRQRIESGERPDVFASANMRHPQALADAGIGGPVVLFVRNQLCARACCRFMRRRAGGHFFVRQGAASAV